MLVLPSHFSQLAREPLVDSESWRCLGEGHHCFMFEEFQDKETEGIRLRKQGY